MIDTERDNGVLTIKVKGRIDGANANQFQDGLMAVVKDEDRTIMLDMENLSYISSAGLRIVLMIARTLGQREAAFMIHSLSDSIREVFEISGFDKIISVHDSREQALASLDEVE